MKAQDIADLDGGSTLAEFYSMADYSTTAGCIPIQFSWRLLGSSLATKRYKVRPYRMKPQEVTVIYGDSTWAQFYSMADSSTTTGCIPILFAGGCWARL